MSPRSLLRRPRAVAHREKKNHNHGCCNCCGNQHGLAQSEGESERDQKHRVVRIEAPGDSDIGRTQHAAGVEPQHQQFCYHRSRARGRAEYDRQRPEAAPGESDADPGEGRPGHGV